MNPTVRYFITYSYYLGNIKVGTLSEARRMYTHTHGIFSFFYAVKQAERRVDQQSGLSPNSLNLLPMESSLNYVLIAALRQRKKEQSNTLQS